jgi:hypothetical protein
MNETRNTNTASHNDGASANGTISSNLHALPSLCRGMYSRVAQKLGCDPSYVSRVARGERSSEAISEALRAEIQQTWALANELPPSKPPQRRSGKPAKPVSANQQIARAANS